MATSTVNHSAFTHASQSIDASHRAATLSQARAAIRARSRVAAHDRLAIDKAMEILATYLQVPGVAFSSPDSVKKYLCLRLGLLPHEVFAVLFLDAQNRLIATNDLFRGTTTQTAVYPREVVLLALQHQAVSVVLAHNHPSGLAKASDADLRLTQVLKAALALVDVRVLDHIIVGGNDALSMAECGLLDGAARG